MNVLILANGQPPSPQLAQALATINDLLIATDGAAHQAVRLGLNPQIICGDFDSIDLETARREFPLAEFVPTPDQSYADLEKAVLLARRRGATSVTISGAAGGRIDHMLANYALLLRYGRDLNLQIVDDSGYQRLVTGISSVATRPGGIVSLIALGSRASVSISGVQWEVRKLALAPGTRGVSNVALGERVTVEVHRGKVVLCHLYPTDETQP
jgi:thiamine pyrophosphokinase